MVLRVCCNVGRCLWPEARVFSDSDGNVYLVQPSVCILDGFCWASKRDVESYRMRAAAAEQVLQVVEVNGGSGDRLGVVEREAEPERPVETMLDEAL